ncbi:MAG: leucine--tRNA ligase [Myxococcales bacterium 68-20]|nr:MAG: leucine--tRNA ligase [Myxococcales bacterium 68-20]
MAEAYDPSVIEPKWQTYWEENKTFRAERRPGRPKKYVLDMFPYPSGAGLHVGHPEGYTATDIVCRFERMRGTDVLHPMGWDAFGLPAEQHAIKTGTHPRSTTLKNIDNFRRQLKMLGFSYDWEREVDTTDPRYVRWTQWIFLQLFKKGLAFQQSNMPVNWCPALGTVLANDEVTADGRSEVGGFPVEKLKIRQWSLKITAYADRLLEGLENLDWPETKAKQAHWIGRSEGANVDFEVEGHPGARITVFTTRVDTLPGATYVVLAPEHALALQIATPEHQAEVKRYADEANAKSDVVRSDATRAKTGVPTGAFAVNPINGDKIPVWVADYVIGSYGTGAVMAVPAHDERDHAFAVKYALPIVRVVAKADGTEVDVAKAAYCDDGVANADAVSRSKAPIEQGMPSEKVRRTVTDWLASQGRGSSKITFKLRDWVFSRQRYWGEPIPIYFPVTTDGDPRKPGTKYEIHYDQPIPLEESELPLLLPDLEDFKPGTDPAGPLARALDWRFFEREGKWFARETNTMPQWAGSCWYYLRFVDPTNDEAGWSPEAYDAWMPVDLYVGGSEHAVLHLLYARFWHKVLFDLGVVKHEEPFQKLVHQGLILGEVEHIVFHEATAVPGSRAKREGDRWVDAETGADLTDRRMRSTDLDNRGGAFYLREADVPVLTTPDGEHFAFYAASETLVSAERAKERDDGSFEDAKTKKTLVIRKVTEQDITKRGAHFTLNDSPETQVLSQAFKMSKSRGNVVNPDVLIKSHGADSLRLYEMFMGPLEAVKPWQTSGIEGVRRFLERVWNVSTTNVTGDPADYDVETQKLVHKTIKKVTEDVQALRFNTAISAMMILVKHLGGLPKVPAGAARALSLLVSPFAPHIGEELWQQLGGKTSLAYEPWPAFDPALVKDDVIEIGVQVNGKARASIQIPADADEAAAKAIALEDPKIKDFTAGKTIKKVIFVKGRILNLIVG